MGMRHLGNRRRRLGNLGWLLAVLLVVQAPWLGWHEATTFHVACASHGELVDVDLRQGLAALLEDHADDPKVDAPAHSDPEQEHEHCQLAGKDLPKAVPSLPAHSFVGMACARVELHPVATPRTDVVAVLHMAPKHSPPG